MKIQKTKISILFLTALLLGACGNSESSESKLSLSDSCVKVKELTPKLAEGIGKAQDEPNKAKEHIGISRDALEQMAKINSEDASFNSTTADYKIKLTAFLDALETALENGGSLIDPSVTPSRDEARTSGEALDLLCK